MRISAAVNLRRIGLTAVALSVVPMLTAATVSAAGPTTVSASAGDSAGSVAPSHSAPPSAPPALTAVTEIDLVSDLQGRAPLVDPALVNPWGLALSPTSPLWVANMGSSSATLYSGGLAGGPVTKVGLAPGVASLPTGQAFNDTTDFVVTGPNGTGAARFLFVTLTGDVAGWNPAASPNAISAAHSDGSSYTGLAMLHTDAGPFLLAADFAKARVDVYDRTFQKVRLPGGFLSDRGIPRGFAPFNVAVAGGSIYVTYAKQPPAPGPAVTGPGLGFVRQ